MQPVTPLPVETEESLLEGEGGARNEPVSYGTEPSKLEQGNMHWTPPVDLSHLSCDQQEAVREMLSEESGALAMDYDDTGCAEDLKLEIKLVDNDPVEKTYNSIPKPLYGEVKSHLQDMINCGWISNPVVCVRKKMVVLDYVLTTDSLTAKSRMTATLSRTSKTS